MCVEILRFVNDDEGIGACNPLRDLRCFEKDGGISARSVENVESPLIRRS